MSFMQWSDTFNTGITSIDTQHHKLVEMLNTFYNHINQNRQNAMKELLNSMASYAVEHFKTEERYFDLYQYPDKTEHKKEHAAFVEEVKKVQADVSAGKPVLTLELTNFLKHWLMDHINGSDKKYVPYLLRKGAQ